jgi:hypothetical protein
MRVSWKLDSQRFGIAALVAGDAAAFWSAANPSFMTTRTFRRKGGKESENVKNDIIAGGAQGSVLALIVGAGGAAIAEPAEGVINGWVLVAVVGVLVYYWSIYGYALANPHGGHNSIADQSGGVGSGASSAGSSDAPRSGGYWLGTIRIAA